MESVFSGMAEGCYRLFWSECGTHGLTVEQKVKALRKLARLSLRTPYWMMSEKDKFSSGLTLTEMFPKLVPKNLCKKHVHLSTLSGLLLYTIHMEIFREVKKLAEDGKLTEQQVKDIGDF